MNDDGPGFELKRFDLDPLPNLSEFKSLMAVWDRKRSADVLPAWRDFSFDELAGWVGNLAVSAFDGKDEFEFLLFGGAFVELFGQELTNKPLFGSLHPAQRDASREHFMAMLKGPMIGHGHGSVPVAGRGHLVFNVIDLPLSENGGEVTHFLHGVTLDSQPRRGG